jgi:hypothetical protein
VIRAGAVSEGRGGDDVHRSYVGPMALTVNGKGAPA